MPEERWIPVIADPQILGNKKIKISLFIVDMLDSEYVDKDHRKITKKQNNMSERSRQITGKNESMRKSLGTSQKEFIKIGTYDDIGNKELIINVPGNKYVKVYESTAHQLIATFSDNTIKVYLYLANNYHLWNEMKNESFRFSKKQLYKEALGHTSEGGYNSDLIEDILTTLALNGLIAYNIVQKGSTFYRALSYVNKHFVIHDKIQEGIKEMTQGLEEISAAEVSKVDGEETTLCSIGFIPKQAQKINNNNNNNTNESLPLNLTIRYLARLEPVPFISVNESLKIMQEKYGHKINNIEDLIDWLGNPWSQGDNDEIISYLRSMI